jgi:hypothetical protein
MSYDHSVSLIDQELWTCELMSRIMGYDHSLSLKEFLNQLNLFYILYVYICNKSKVMSTRANRPHYGLRPLSKLKGYILKIIYYVMIVYILKQFLVLVSCSAIMLSF